MRLFVYASGFLFGMMLLSMNYLSTTSAISTADASSQSKSVCSFQDVDVSTSISAKAWQITDMDTGNVLAEYQSDVVFPFASVVKLITAHVVLRQGNNYDTDIVLTHNDIDTIGRAGNLATGETYTARELLFPLLVTSSNDAGVALARTYPDIISQMQNFVQSVEASDTVIVDTTGLSNQNLTTVHDLALIVEEIYGQSRHLFDITRTPQIISRYETGWLNNIPFRSLAGYQGGKQGYLPEVGQSGVAVFAISAGETKTFSITILSSKNVANDMSVLHDAVLQSYTCH